MPDDLHLPIPRRNPEDINLGDQDRPGAPDDPSGMNEIITERPFTQSNYGWTIFANDIPERLETHTHDSLRRPLSSPVTFTIPARREWLGQHRRSGKILGPFGSQEEAQAAVDADYAAE